MNLKIYVGCLPGEATEEMVKSLFGVHGQIKEVILIKKKSRKCIGSGYIICQDKTTYDRILAAEVFYQDRKLETSPFLEKEELQKLHEDINIRKVLVKNLPVELTNEELYDLFRMFGEVVNAFISSDKKQDVMRPTNYGIIIFKERIAAYKAINCSILVKGNPVIIRLHRFKNVGQAVYEVRGKKIKAIDLIDVQIGRLPKDDISDLMPGFYRRMVAEFAQKRDEYEDLMRIDRKKLKKDCKRKKDMSLKRKIMEMEKEEELARKAGGGKYGPRGGALGGRRRNKRPGWEERNHGKEGYRGGYNGYGEPAGRSWRGGRGARGRGGHYGGRNHQNQQEYGYDGYGKSGRYRGRGGRSGRGSRYGGGSRMDSRDNSVNSGHQKSSRYSNSRDRPEKRQDGYAGFRKSKFKQQGHQEQYGAYSQGFPGPGHSLNPRYNQEPQKRYIYGNSPKQVSGGRQAHQGPLRTSKKASNEASKGNKSQASLGKVIKRTVIQSPQGWGDEDQEVQEIPKIMINNEEQPKNALKVLPDKNKKNSKDQNFLSAGASPSQRSQNRSQKSQNRSQRSGNQTQEPQNLVQDALNLIDNSSDRPSSAQYKNEYEEFNHPQNSQKRYLNSSPTAFERGGLVLSPKGSFHQNQQHLRPQLGRVDAAGSRKQPSPSNKQFLVQKNQNGQNLPKGQKKLYIPAGDFKHSQLLHQVQHAHPKRPQNSRNRLPVPSSPYHLTTGDMTSMDDNDDIWNWSEASHTPSNQLHTSTPQEKVKNGSKPVNFSGKTLQAMRSLLTSNINKSGVVRKMKSSSELGRGGSSLGQPIDKEKSIFGEEGHMSPMSFSYQSKGAPNGLKSTLTPDMRPRKLKNKPKKLEKLTRGNSLMVTLNEIKEEDEEDRDRKRMRTINKDTLNMFIKASVNEETSSKEKSMTFGKNDSKRKNSAEGISSSKPGDTHSHKEHHESPNHPENPNIGDIEQERPVSEKQHPYLNRDRGKSQVLPERELSSLDYPYGLMITSKSVYSPFAGGYRQYSQKGGYTHNQGPSRGYHMFSRSPANYRQGHEHYINLHTENEGFKGLKRKAQPTMNSIQPIVDHREQYFNERKYRSLKNFDAPQRSPSLQNVDFKMQEMENRRTRKLSASIAPGSDDEGSIELDEEYYRFLEEIEQLRGNLDHRATRGVVYSHQRPQEEQTRTVGRPGREIYKMMRNLRYKVHYNHFLANLRFKWFMLPKLGKIQARRGRRVGEDTEGIDSQLSSDSDDSSSESGDEGVLGQGEAGKAADGVNPGAADAQKASGHGYEPDNGISDREDSGDSESSSEDSGTSEDAGDENEADAEVIEDARTAQD